jgi:DivIVA domain-containing protein
LLFAQERHNSQCVSVDERPASREQASSQDEPEQFRTTVPTEIRNASFPVSVRGYDRHAVDAYVKNVNRVIAELEVSRSPQAAVRHAVERVSEQTKAILQEARESAEKITDTAREEADQIMAEAKAKAADLVVNADANAERVKAESQQLLADSEAKADRILAKAKEESAEHRRQAEEELAELHNQAEARMRDLQADTDAVWKERDGLLDEIEGMAGRLQEAARQAATRVPSPETDEAEPAAGDSAATVVTLPAQDD